MNPASPPPLRLLAVEDNELDYQLLLEELAWQGWPCEARRVETLADLSQALSQATWDLVISDHGLPGFSSVHAWDRVRSLPEPPPFIIVSGVLGEDAAVQAMQRGVDDYLVKGRLARLGTAVRNALAGAAERRAKEAAQARAEDYRRQLQALSAQLQNALDEERTRVAREVHDEIGGTLTAVRFDLEASLREAPQDGAARVRRALGELALVQQASQRIVYDLRPPILDAGLVAALQWHTAQFAQRQGVALRFRSSHEALDLPAGLAMTLYRACQEALTNIGKHAHARQVEVDLHHGQDTLSLEIEDDGRGFDTAATARPDAFGLRGLAERMRAVGGELQVSSAPGRTTLMLWVPLPQETL